MGGQTGLAASGGERVGAVLFREGVPPSSVIVLRREIPVSDDHLLVPGESYEAQLIEGYDLATVRAARDALAGADEGCAPYVQRRLYLTPIGGLETERQSMELDELAAYVEDTVYDTCAEFDLMPRGSSVLLGLSGGVDSTSLLLALDAVRRRRGNDFEIVAATFEDADMRGSPTFSRASLLARELGVQHVVIPAARAEEVFGLTGPLDEVLPALMETEYAHVTMYADHHITRRLLEVETDARGIDRIALGLHTSDLVAGLINGFMTGYASGSLPSRTVGHHVYVYPLAFLAKRALHLYHLQRRGHLASHTEPNGWERHPTDRNFYYWLADALQELWPGHEQLLLAGQETRVRGLTQLVYVTCTNCGASLLQQPFSAVEDGECDVCQALRAAGLTRSEAVT